MRVIPGFREIVSIVHSRGKNDLKFDGEFVAANGRTGIDVAIPATFEPALAMQIARDLEMAFDEMGYGYVIRRDAGTDSIPQEDRQSALGKLEQLGVAAKIMPDGKISLSQTPDARRQNAELLREKGERIYSLLLDAHGTRKRWEILAKSENF